MTSKNISQQLRDCISVNLGVNIVDQHSKYLGLPLQLSRRRSDTFNGLIDKIFGKTQSWQSSILSIGGRQILIHAVLNALPQYWLSCFLLPDKVINKIHSSITNFWWQKAGGSKSVHWVKAETMRQDKEEGGLGFLNFKWLNLAYLAKQCWRLIKNPESLVSKVFKAKYFNQCHLLHSRIGYRPSHFWQGLHKALPLIKNGISIDNVTGEVNWKENNNGIFDIKSAYRVARRLYQANNPGCSEQSDSSHLKKFWKQIWKLPIPHKIKIFIWRAYHGGLPTGSQLSRRNLGGTTHCHICFYRWENEKHVFLDCWWSNYLWHLMHLDIMDCCNGINTFADIIYYVFTSVNTEKLCMIIITLWYIWYNRNLAAHGKTYLSPDMAVRRIKMLFNEFLSNNGDMLKSLDAVSLTWQRPKGSFVKANCDASWDPVTKEAGVGVLIRDSRGFILGLSFKYYPCCADVYYSEGLALQEAIALVEKLKLKHVLLETDSRDVVMAINYKTDPNVWSTKWYMDCCRKLESRKNWKVIFTRREANLAADAIARNARIEKLSWSRLDAIPYLKNVVQFF